MTPNLYKILLINIFGIVQVQFARDIFVLVFCCNNKEPLSGITLPTEYLRKIREPYFPSPHASRRINLATILVQLADLGYDVILLRNANNTEDVSQQIGEDPRISLRHISHCKFYKSALFHKYYNSHIKYHEIYAKINLIRLLATKELTEEENVDSVIYTDFSLDPTSKKMELKAGLEQLQKAPFCSGIIDPPENGVAAENSFFMIRKQREEEVSDLPEIFRYLESTTFYERLVNHEVPNYFLYQIHILISLYNNNIAQFITLAESSDRDCFQFIFNELIKNVDENNECTGYIINRSERCVDADPLPLFLNYDMTIGRQVRLNLPKSAVVVPCSRLNYGLAQSYVKAETIKLRLDNKTSADKCKIYQYSLSNGHCLLFATLTSEELIAEVKKIAELERLADEGNQMLCFKNRPAA